MGHVACIMMCIAMCSNITNHFPTSDSFCFDSMCLCAVISNGCYELAVTATVRK